MPKTPWADRYRAAPTNKSNVMRTIILEGPISRAALAKRVGLSLPSVMTITENLINRGLVRAVGKGKSSGGKPPELLSVAFFRTVMLYNLMKVNAKFPQQPCVFICDRCKINKKFQPFINVSGMTNT